MNYLIYNILIIITFPLLLGFFIITNLKRINIRLLKSVPQRFGVVGFLKRLPPDRERVWVHCASLGEVRVGIALIDRLRALEPEKLFLISVMTQTAYDWVDRNRRVDGLFYLPFDLPFVIGAFMKKISPEALLVIETELWPNLIKKANQAGVLVGLVNARISDKNFKAIEKISSFMGEVVGYFDFILARTVKDENRFAALGAQPGRLAITGNIKYDLTDAGGDAADLSSVHNDFGVKKCDKIVTVGSLRAGEEGVVIGACKKLRSMIPGIKFIIAPRHMERIAYLKNLLKKDGFSFTTKSGLKAAAPAGDCILLDVYGELTKAYSISDICIIGGSIRDFGGQNLIEPALLKKAILCGPFMSNFEDAYELLRAGGALTVFKDEDELVSAVKNILETEGKAAVMGEKAGKIIRAQRGALSRNADIIKKYMGASIKQ